MFNFTTVVFDGTSPTFYFTNTSGWNTSSIDEVKVSHVLNLTPRHETCGQRWYSSMHSNLYVMWKWIINVCPCLLYSNRKSAIISLGEDMLGTRGGCLWCGIQNECPGQESKPAARLSSSHPSQYNETAVCMQPNMSNASQVHDNGFGCRWRLSHF